MKQKRFLGLFLLTGLLGLLVAGCASTSSRGWAAPIVDDGTQFVTATKGKLEGIDASANPEPAWTGALSQDLNASATTLLDNSVSPSGTVFQGDLLHIDDEILRVSSLRVEEDGREMVLQRGHAGTEAAEHGSGAKVAAFRRPWRFPDDWQIPNKSARGLGGIYGQPVADSDGTVYFADYNGFAYAFRPGDVRLDSRSDDEQPLAASVELEKPIIGGVALDSSSGTLYVAAQDNVYALSTAELKNKLQDSRAPVQRKLFKTTQDEIWATPVVTDDTVLIASRDGILYAVSKSNGQEKWRYNAGKALVTTPVVADGRVLVAGFSNQLYAIDLNSGELDWTAPASDWVWSAPAVKDGVAYFGDFDGILHAVNVDDGSEAWSLKLGHGTLRASPAIVGDNLVIGSDDGWLMGVSINSRQQVWEKDLGTALRADMVAHDDSVLLAPDGCVTPPDGGDKVYYRAVDPANGDLTPAEGVC